jgi:hypothetical protein
MIKTILAVKKREAEIKGLEKRYNVSSIELCLDAGFTPNLLQYRIENNYKIRVEWLENQNFKLLEYPNHSIKTIDPYEMMIYLILLIPISFVNLLVQISYHLLVLFYVFPSRIDNYFISLIFVPIRLLYCKQYDKESIKILNLVVMKAINIEAKNAQLLKDKQIKRANLISICLLILKSIFKNDSINSPKI